MYLDTLNVVDKSKLHWIVHRASADCGVVDGAPRRPYRTGHRVEDLPVMKGDDRSVDQGLHDAVSPMSTRPRPRAGER